LFDHPDDGKPVRVIDLDPVRHRTGDVWHVWVAGINPGQLYAYRADGTYEPNKGLRFNFNRLLLDPFAAAISRLPPWDFASARGYDASAPEQDLVISTQDNGWYLAVDTSGLTPLDLFVAGTEALVDETQTYRVQQCSSAILLARAQSVHGWTKPGAGASSKKKQTCANHI
jgi:hypothetical protein